MALTPAESGALSAKKRRLLRNRLEKRLQNPKMVKSPNPGLP